LQVSKAPQVLKGRLVRRDHLVPWVPRERPDYKVPQGPRATAARLDLRDQLECRGPRVMLAFPGQLG
jgi:hypothetical protein